MANLFTRASAAIDRSVVRFMERRMAPRTPRIDPGDARVRLMELAAAYSAETLGAPSPFFPAPTPATMTPERTLFIYSIGYVLLIFAALALDRNLA